MISKLITLGLAALALFVVSSAEAAEWPLQRRADDMPMKAPADFAPSYFKGPLRPVVAYHSWTGFYVGINGGYGFGRSNWDAPAVSPDPSGWMIGGTLGHNWQAGSFVYGIEGDIDWSTLKGSTACGITTCETRNPWLATARLRLGYGFDRALIYLTGGGAYGKVEATNVGFGSASRSSLGWTVGGGLEYSIFAGWSAKAEYLYVDLGKFNCGLSCSGLTPAEVGFSAGIVRAGLNYKFSGPISSRY